MDVRLDKASARYCAETLTRDVDCGWDIQEGTAHPSHPVLRIRDATLLERCVASPGSSIAIRVRSSIEICSYGWQGRWPIADRTTKASSPLMASGLRCAA